MPSSLSVNGEEPLDHSKLRFKVKSSVSSPLDFGVHRMKPLQYTKRQVNGFTLDATTCVWAARLLALRLCWPSITVGNQVSVCSLRRMKHLRGC